jgi:hypothetical protein
LRLEIELCGYSMGMAWAINGAKVWALLYTCRGNALAFERLS